MCLNQELIAGCQQTTNWQSDREDFGSHMLSGNMGADVCCSMLQHVTSSYPHAPVMYDYEEQQQQLQSQSAAPGHRDASGWMTDEPERKRSKM